MALEDEDITTTPAGPGDLGRTADAREAEREHQHEEAEDAGRTRRSTEGPMDGGANPHGTDGGADGGAQI